jgi:hypothetical protein
MHRPVDSATLNGSIEASGDEKNNRHIIDDNGRCDRSLFRPCGTGFAGVSLLGAIGTYGREGLRDLGICAGLGIVLVSIGVGLYYLGRRIRH